MLQTQGCFTTVCNNLGMPLHNTWPHSRLGAHGPCFWVGCKLAAVAGAVLQGHVNQRPGNQKIASHSCRASPFSQHAQFVKRQYSQQTRPYIPPKSLRFYWLRYRPFVSSCSYPSMAPLILHNVPDEELYVGDDGIQRPYAMVFPQCVSSNARNNYRYV